MRNIATGMLMFLGGFALMVLEVVGARFLARDFGNNFYVWVNQIGVILTALSLGYFAGGALADRFPRARVLAWMLVPAGLFIWFIPELSRPLLDWIVNRHPAGEPLPTLWQKLDPVLGSAIVFLLPGFVLATLSPFMIRLISESITQVGRVSGMVYAAGTVGSIAGVFVSGYVLIEHMRISSIFRGTGALTVGLGILSALMDTGRRARLVSPMETRLLILAVAWGWGWGSPSTVRSEVVAELTSPYHHIEVVDEGGFRLLSFDGSMESRFLLQDPWRGHFEYTDYFHMAWLWNSNISQVLMIGLGGATTQRVFERNYPDVTVETVEIDPMVVALAKQYFYFRESGRQRVHAADGRVFLRRARSRWDLIIMDAYSRNRYGSYLPQHLATKEFFQLAQSRLSTNGILCYNVMGTLQGWSSDLVGALYKTMKAVFPNVYLFPAGESHNVVLLATQSPAKGSFSELNQRATFLIRRKRIQWPAFRDRLYRVNTQAPYSVNRVPVLTDDFAPIEGLMNQPSRTRDESGKE
jgi:spermidine synthase